jgi:hypothetical protein
LCYNDDIIHLNSKNRAIPPPPFTRSSPTFSSAAVWRRAARWIFQESGASGGPPPGKTGDGWWEDGRRRAGGVAGGRRNSGGTPGPLNWNPSVLLSGRTQGTKKRLRRDLTGAAFCGRLQATPAPPRSAWRPAPPVGVALTAGGIFVWKGAIQSIPPTGRFVKFG